MKNDYLWDRTGELDADMQELEEVLGTLRYQPHPLVLPADVQPAARRRYFPVLAIAAAIALIGLAIGIWLRVQHQRISQPDQIVKTQKEGPPARVDNAPPVPDKVKEEIPDNNFEVSKRRTSATNRNKLALRLKQTNPSPQLEEMTPEQRAEAELARDQLMLALRVVTAKLNLAQRKTVPATNNIRNQHKVG